MFTITKIKSIFVVVVYMLFLYFAIAYEYMNGYWILIGAIDKFNIGTKLLTDFMNGLLFVFVIIFINRKETGNLRNMGITMNSSILVISLFLIYLLQFFIIGDFSPNGIYRFYFYLIFISLPEEFIFRGYLFNSLNRHLSYRSSIIISGVLWSIPHAYLPAIKSGASYMVFVVDIISQMGGGILMGFLFIHIYKKSNNLLVPILLHAIMDYNPSKFI